MFASKGLTVKSQKSEASYFRHINPTFHKDLLVIQPLTKGDCAIQESVVSRILQFTYSTVFYNFTNITDIRRKVFPD